MKKIETAFTVAAALGIAATLSTAAGPPRLVFRGNLTPLRRKTGWWRKQGMFWRDEITAFIRMDGMDLVTFFRPNVLAGEARLWSTQR